MKFKILTIIGARPHFVKAAMVSRAIRGNESLEECIVHTGQHYDHSLSGAFFEELALPNPQYNLGVGSARPLQQLALMLAKLDEVIIAESPDMIIVYGDTNSTAAGAIAAAKCNIPLAHIEAGLREFDKQIPEEINKLLTDAIADLYFCPTQTGVDNLAKVGVENGVYLVGDVGIDLIAANANRIEAAQHEVLGKYGVEKKNYYLVTCHREANTDTVEHLSEIVKALVALKEDIVFPLHPRTRKALEQHDLLETLAQPHIRLVEPLKFWETQTLLKYSKMAITDSGGIIKEAYYHKTPAVIIDKQTEWLETVAEGWNQIAGPNMVEILTKVSTWEKPNIHTNCLGDGQAAIKAVDEMLHYLLKRKTTIAI